jgi:hypothetical protein
MVDNLRLAALGACSAALRPIIRMLIKHGVMHREFVELSKEIYIDVVRREYGIRGRPTNLSRVALLTGLDRKEVGRIKTKLDREHSAVVHSPPQHKQDRIARVLSGWYQDPDYVTGDGTPRVLPLEGSAPSYEDLVRRYGGDVPAVTILRELKRTAAIQSRDDGTVQVLRRNYRLDTADPEALSRAGSVLNDVGETVTHNLYRQSGEPSRLEARASNTNIPASAVDAYRTFIYGEGQAFLEKVDEWLSHQQVSDDQAARTPVRRLGVGLYWIESDSAAGTGP